MDRGLIVENLRGSFARFQALTGNLSVDSGGNDPGPSIWDRMDQTFWGRGRRREHWRAAALGGGVAGLHQNGDSVLAFEWNLIRKQERGTLNRSRGLTQGQGTAEARCGGEAGRPTPVSHRARCRGKLRRNWAREGSLPWREGPEMLKGGRAEVQGWIHGSVAER